MFKKDVDIEKSRKEGSFSSNELVSCKVTWANFERIMLENQELRESIASIPDYLKGEATAIIKEGMDFDHDVTEGDSKAFYDIESGIKKELKETENYGFEIIYHY